MDSRSLRVVASARASLALRDEFPHWWVPRVSKRCLEEIWQISPLVSPWYLSLYTVGHQKGPLKKIGLEDDVAYKFQNRLSVGRRFVVWPFGIFSGFYVRRCCQPRMVGSFEGRVNCCILLLGLWFPMLLTWFLEDMSYQSCIFLHQHRTPSWHKGFGLSSCNDPKWISMAGWGIAGFTVTSSWPCLITGWH